MKAKKFLRRLLISVTEAILSAAISEVLHWVIILLK